MNSTTNTQRGRAARGVRGVFLVAATLAALIGTGASGSALTVTGVTDSVQTPANVQRAVFDFAQGHPGQPIPVIVQNRGDSQSLISSITSLGGTVDASSRSSPLYRLTSCSAPSFRSQVTPRYRG